MAGFTFILGIIGNVISILMFATPIKTFKQVAKKKSTENYKGIPYVTTLLSTCLWTFYGILIPQGLLVVTVNGAGVALHVIYVALFIYYAPKILKVKYLKLVAILNVFFLGALIAVTLVGLKDDKRIKLVGFICAGFTICMYAAPLSSMKLVIKSKSVKYMPFLLSFFQFLNGGLWTGYAVLIKDIFIAVPNGIGFLLGSAQLILYLIYKNKPLSEELEEKAEKDGSAHLFQGAVQMQDLEENHNLNTKNRNLYKENSLPKPPIVRDYNQKIIKTFSLSPYELGEWKQKAVEEGLMKPA